MAGSSAYKGWTHPRPVTTIAIAIAIAITIVIVIVIVVFVVFDVGINQVTVRFGFEGFKILLRDMSR